MQIDITHEANNIKFTCTTGSSLSIHNFTISVKEDKIILDQMTVEQMHFTINNLEHVIYPSAIPYTISKNCSKFRALDECYLLVVSTCPMVKKRKLEVHEEKGGLKKRKLNRVMSSSYNVMYPSYWTDQETYCKCFELEKGTEEWRKIAEPFVGRNIDVLRIERVQNKILYDLYWIKKFWMECKTPNSEKMLYHGTDSRYIGNIIREGLDHRLAKMTGRIGAGIYFAENPIDSLDYSRGNSTDNMKQILVCRVAIGKTMIGTAGMRRPPYVDENTKEMADSVYGLIGNGLMYAIFDNLQSYPEYIVHFKSNEQKKALLPNNVTVINQYSSRQMISVVPNMVPVWNVQLLNTTSNTMNPNVFTASNHNKSPVAINKKLIYKNNNNSKVGNMKMNNTNINNNIIDTKMNNINSSNSNNIIDLKIDNNKALGNSQVLTNNTLANSQVITNNTLGLSNSQVLTNNLGDSQGLGNSQVITNNTLDSITSYAPNDFKSSDDNNNCSYFDMDDLILF